MRIGLNLLFLKPGLVGGTQTYTEGLLKGLAAIGNDHEFVLFINLDCQEIISGLPSNFIPVTCRIHGRIRPIRLIYEQTVLPFLVRRHRIDILHSLGQTTPLVLGCPSVVTIHDANYWACGKFFPLTERLIGRAFVRQTVFSADHIIAVSKFTRQELVRWLDVKSEQITVIHEGYPQENVEDDSGGWDNDLAILGDYGITPPFLLTVASPWPHKNVSGLIKAYSRLLHLGPAPPLVVVGRNVDNMPDVAAELKSLGKEAKVIFTGYLPYSKLRVFYRNAMVFLFPSLYEGFGLPILEALSFGLPVISSNAASLPEVGGDAVLLVDPNDPESFAQRIRRVLDDSDLRSELIRRGKERIKDFSWEKTAKETLEVYQKVKG